MSKFSVVGSTLVYNAKVNKFNNTVFVSLDDIDDATYDNPGVTKLKVTPSVNANFVYETNLEDLRTLIESSEDIESTNVKGKEIFLVSLDESIFKKIQNKVTDTDKWLAARTKIIEESGGYWSYEKLQQWRAKFAAPTKRG